MMLFGFPYRKYMNIETGVTRGGEINVQKRIVR